MKTIENREDIESMVNGFYTMVRQDNLLGPIFNKVVNGNWEKHLDTMYRFWHTILLHEKAYKGEPFSKHTRLPIEKIHFDRWVHLFHVNIDNQFTGTIAEEAKMRAASIAQIFNYKIEYLNNKAK